MDYEKKYRDLVEAVKELQEANPSDDGIQKWVEDNVPELKESDDERIRKALIKYYSFNKDGGSHALNNITPEQILDWLERQGEQKTSSKVKPKFRIGDVIEVKPMKCYGKIFTGKPNKIIDITEESYILDDGKAYSIELQDGWKLSEQKPADKVEPIVIRDFNSVFSREQVEEIDKRIEESQRLYNAKLRDAIQKVEDFPMTD